MLRATAVAALCLISVQAQAMPCWLIKQYVSIHGEEAVISWAKAHGYSDKDIEKAKKCLRY